MTANPRLSDGQLGDLLVEHIKEYQKMLDFTNREWPKDFPMQNFIDDRAQAGERDGLPTTAMLKEFSDDEDDNGASQEETEEEEMNQEEADSNEIKPADDEMEKTAEPTEEVADEVEGSGTQE